jgi:hypothetical protein
MGHSYFTSEDRLHRTTLLGVKTPPWKKSFGDSCFFVSPFCLFDTLTN